MTLLSLLFRLLAVFFYDSFKEEEEEEDYCYFFGEQADEHFAFSR